MSAATDQLAAATSAVTSEVASLTTTNGVLTGQVSTLTSLNSALAAEIVALKAQIANPPTTGNPPLPTGWTKELWADYFNGNVIDAAKWNVRNDSGQNNNYANNLASNVVVKDGTCSIKGGKNAAGAADPYNAGYIDTKGKASWGGEFRAEARLRFPYGPAAYGLWPAWWMRPDDGGDGEIDMMECWPRKGQVSATIHHDYRKDGEANHFPHVGKNFPVQDWTQWHVFAVEKGTGYLRFYVDGALVWDASSVAWRAEIFDNARKWHFRHCLQIGDSWGGQPTAATDFSKTFDTDYIRVLGR